MKNNIIYVAILGWICSSCNDGSRFSRTEFDMDYRQQEITVTTKWTGWDITELSINGDCIEFSGHDGISNKREMEIDRTSIKIDYEIEGKYDEQNAYLDGQSGKEYHGKPVKLSGEWFEIVKPADKKIKVSLKQNLTGRERTIKISAGNGNYSEYINIIQKAKQ